MSDEKSLQDDLNEMLGDTKEELKKAAERVSKKAGEFAEEAKEAIGSAKEKASEFAGDAKEKASEFTDEAKDAYEKISGENKKVLAGITAILLGGLGVHKFVLGYYKEGVILLAITIGINIFSFGFLGLLVWAFTLIEGIIYLTKTNNEFFKIYQKGKKPWF
ncbi:NINE protein [Flavobacteriaceae bacterium AU392]|nr:NINE protein [Flavobacteriaceae bacterium]RKM84071.1 NINE protein [Flavobacteriaceae bacterium AU392]